MVTNLIRLMFYSLLYIKRIKHFKWLITDEQVQKTGRSLFFNYY
ncbi:hypothetical protein PTRA_a1949 [Pseudoalteromonas translucida KMM 520]|uniref:Uncharacterized protein n=1 Tax=Pseudoalteromonas translucida KMM 520 TaxID=1315283 RepID=A0A0U2ISM0_9GAMM|nr:hypothetical protein PTRA_a1949 [Pseudoalteromonas translucida KMM 520]